MQLQAAWYWTVNAMTRADMHAAWHGHEGRQIRRRWEQTKVLWLLTKIALLSGCRQVIKELMKQLAQAGCACSKSGVLLQARSSHSRRQAGIWWLPHLLVPEMLTVESLQSHCS